MNKKLLIKLALFLPMMMALASCSSMGGMQTMQHKAGQAMSAPKPHIAKHHPVITKKKTTKPTPQPVVEIVTEVPSKNTQIEQITIMEPIKVQNKSLPITMKNPVVGQLWLLPIHGVELQAHSYRKSNQRHVVENIGRMDKTSGNYHYIQVTRWDGIHMDKAYINARTAAMLSLLGVGALESGYIKTNFGSYILIFAGKGVLIDLPASQYELVPAKKIKKPAKKHSERKVRIKSNLANFNPNDFYLIDGKVYNTLNDTHTKRVATQKVTHKKVAATKMNKINKYCRVKHDRLNTPEDMVASLYRISLKN